MAAPLSQIENASAQNQLLAVLTFSKTHKTICQRAGCGSPLFSKAYLVHISGEFVLLGRDCFCAMFGHEWGLGRPIFMPEYRPSDGARFVNYFERELLLKKPVQFVAVLQREHANAVRAKAQIMAKRPGPKRDKVRSLAIVLHLLSKSRS